jgi:hypothetical protein
MNRNYLIVGVVVFLIIVIGGLLLLLSGQQSIPSQYTQKPVIRSSTDAQSVASDVDTTIADVGKTIDSLAGSLS